MHFILLKMSISSPLNEKLEQQKLLYCNQRFSRFWTHFDDRPKILTYRQISPNIFHLRLSCFFSDRVFFHGHWRHTGQQGKGWGHLFYSTTSTHSQISRDLFPTLHVRWLSHIFKRTGLLLDEIYHLVKLPFDWLMMWH